MRIVFLDFDGVLNSLRSAMAFNGYPHRLPGDLRLFDPLALRMVHRLCSVTGAQVVVSSTWRRSHTAATLKKSLRLPIIGCTPASNDPEIRRGDEIKSWISSQTEPIEKYCIIDDDSDMLEEQLPFFVKCCGEVGFSAQNYKDAVALLGTPTGSLTAKAPPYGGTL